jgi:hypothetical protein
LSRIQRVSPDLVHLAGGEIADDDDGFGLVRDEVDPVQPRKVTGARSAVRLSPSTTGVVARDPEGVSRGESRQVGFPRRPSGSRAGPNADPSAPSSRIPPGREQPELPIMDRLDEVKREPCRLALKLAHLASSVRAFR